MSSSTTAAPRAPLAPRRAAPAALVGGLVAAGVAMRLGPAPWELVGAATAGLLVWVAAIDLEVRLVPNRIVLPATIAVLVLAVALEGAGAAVHLLWALALPALLLLVRTLDPAGLGMGDVKLAALLGALLGAAALTALVVSFALAGAVGLALVLRRGRVALKHQLPLAPFLAAGAVVILLGG